MQLENFKEATIMYRDLQSKPKEMGLVMKSGGKINPGDQISVNGPLDMEVLYQITKILHKKPSSMSGHDYYWATF